MRTWTAAIPMTKQGAPDRIFESACHERNYAVPNILSGAGADTGALRSRVRASSGKRASPASQGG